MQPKPTLTEVIDTNRPPPSPYLEMFVQQNNSLNLCWGVVGRKESVMQSVRQSVSQSNKKEEGRRRRKKSYEDRRRFAEDHRGLQKSTEVQILAAEKTSIDTLKASLDISLHSTVTNKI